MQRSSKTNYPGPGKFLCRFLTWAAVALAPAPGDFKESQCNMGMDVHGNSGNYFRANVWSWHPLWDYCQLVAPALTNQVAYAHSNDGDGLCAEDSTALAATLEREIKSGRTQAYLDERQAELDGMSKEPCEICGGTGKRAEPPNTGPGEMPCNGCEATGSRKPFECNYGFDLDHLKEFVVFLKESEGFQID